MLPSQYSLTYRFVTRLGLHISEAEYGQISFYSAICRMLKNVMNSILLKYCMYGVLLAPLMYRKIRPYLWRKMGIKVGKNCFIGYDVWVDITNTELIELEDGVHVTTRCILLCHQRDLTEYRKNDDSSALPYHKKKILLKKGCMIGMGSIIMPGVTVGEGAVIGAGSLVCKDIPPWSIAAGVPARVIKNIPEK